MGELGDRLARGEQSAFAELFDRCAGRLLAYLLARLGCRADAEDVLQETFVRLAGRRSHLADVENLMAYTFTVARNEAARVLSGRRRAVASHEPLETVDQAGGAESTLESREANEALLRALARLQPEQREIVELKIYAGLTLREIAEVTAQPAGTVATRYRAALAQLRQRLRKSRHE